MSNGGAPKGNRNALKHGAMVAESIALRREVQALARMARKTIAAVEQGCRDRQESTHCRHSNWQQCASFVASLSHVIVPMAKPPSADGLGSRAF